MTRDYSVVSRLRRSLTAIINLPAACSRVDETMGNSFRDLRVWNESIDLVVEVYRVTAQFPGEERYGLTGQIRRAAISVPSNIAEGQGRSTRGEWKQFLGHARGSLNEVETVIEICCRLGIAPPEVLAALKERVDRVGGLLLGLTRFVDGSSRSRHPQPGTRNP